MKEQANLVKLSEYVIGRTPAYYQDGTILCLLQIIGCVVQYSR